MQQATIYFATLLWVLSSSCDRSRAQDSGLDSALRFVDASDSAGVGFEHTDGSSGKRYIIESLTAGMALLDYDGDGLSDLYFLNGAPLPGTPEPESLPSNRLYRNLGNWRFQDVTEESGAGDTGYGLGVVSADYDQDGDADLYITNFGDNTFLINQGDGTFLEHTLASGVACDRFGAGATFGDFDGDGDLDLYSANYQDFRLDQHRLRYIGKHQFHPGPHDYPPQADRLFQNQGDGRFVDISTQAGIDAVASTGMGVLATDFDQDGDLDLFVANDSRPNFLWINDGSGKFTEEGILVGVAYDRTGKTNGNMGVEPIDYDSDGQIDLFTTTYQSEMPVMYRNEYGFFQDTTNIVDIDRALHPHVNWGIGAEDFDNDGDTDLFVACGHFMDNIRFIDDRTEVKVQNYLLENRGGRFFSVASQAGSGLTPKLSSRSACFEDLDQDGDVDGVVMNFQARPTLLRNESSVDNHWIRLRLVGTQDNRDAIGARVKVIAEGLQQVKEVYSGRGYQSSYGQSLHFGFGRTKGQVQVEVLWPNQTKESYQVEMDCQSLLVQGAGELL